MSRRCTRNGIKPGIQRFGNVENGYGLSGLRIFDTEKYGGTKLGIVFENPIYWAGPPIYASGKNKLFEDLYILNVAKKDRKKHMP